ncbi:hypothetical protein OK016_23690 [Vibrio chagasii]|nr:hypothetical protein [Vibrio chagasii]
MAYTGWQDYGVSGGEGLQAGKAPSSLLTHCSGIYGHARLYRLWFAGYQPTEGDTRGSGSGCNWLRIGFTVGQIGKLKAVCRVIGVAGDSKVPVREKRFLVSMNMYRPQGR